MKKQKRKHRPHKRRPVRHYKARTQQSVQEDPSWLIKLIILFFIRFGLLPSAEEKAELRRTRGLPSREGVFAESERQLARLPANTNTTPHTFRHGPRLCPQETHRGRRSVKKAA